MAGDKQKRYCTIIDWLRQNDSELYDALDQLCMLGNLTPKGRGSGTTFLVPDTKARAEILKGAASDSDAQIDKAVDLVKAHILPVSAATAADMRGEVGSLLGVKLETESVSGGEVRLKGGAVLAPEPSFRAQRRDNIHVWRVKSGEVPLSGPEFTRSRVRRGGAEASASLGSRALLARRTEQTFQTNRGIYLEQVVSLLGFLKRNHQDLYTCVLPLVDRDPTVSFYILVEPYKTSGPYLLPDAVLVGDDGWQGAVAYQGSAVECLEQFLSSIQGAGGEALLFRDPQKVSNARMQVQDSMNSQAQSARTTPEMLQRIYAAFTNEGSPSQNQLAGVGPILPASTLRAVQGGKKLWQDMLRFRLHAMMAELARDGYPQDGYADVLIFIRSMMPGNDYSAEVKPYLSAPQSQVAPTFQELCAFNGSTDFLYVALPKENVGSWGSASVSGGADAQPYNAETSKIQHLQQFSGVHQDGLNRECMLQLQAYREAHGSLPAGL